MPISKRASPRKDGVQARKKLRTSVVDEEVKDKVNALDAWPDIRELLTNERVAVFLDYDGTLTPIVNDPAEAKICEEMRHVVSRLAHCMPTAIVTGRNIKTITDFMRLDHLFYAASHGFDIVSPEGRETHFEKVGDRFLPHLRKFRRNITKKVSDIEAAQVEDNTYAISVHYRNVQGEDDVRRVADAVDAELANYPGLLRRSDGKMVHEIKPVIDWDKGKALDWLLQHGIQNGPSMVPCYIGDDVTDEDAFRAVAKNKKGISIHVREPGKARHTDAQYVLSDPNQVQQFLQLLATLPQPQENGGNGDGGTKKVNGRSKAHHRLHRGEDDGKPADEDHAAEREEKAGSILTRSALALRRPPSPPKLGSPASSAGSAISSASSSTSSSSSPSGHASAAGVSAKRRRKKKSTMTKKKKRTGNSKAVAV